MPDIQTVIDLYKQHQSYAIVGRKLGVSRQRIEAQLKRVDDPQVAAIRQAKWVRNLSSLSCSVCLRPFGPGIRPTISGKCEACKQYERKHANRPSSGRRHIFLSKACIECGRLFSKKLRRAGQDRCQRCYLRYQYRTNPNRRASLARSGKKYRQTHKEQVQDRHKAYWPAYYAENKDHIREVIKQWKIKKNLI